MPWLETVAMDQRLQFIEDALSDRFHDGRAVCAVWHQSTRGYKWLARYAEEGKHGLQDRSRAPQHCPPRISDEIAGLLCELRGAHPYWGARKLLAVLRRRHPTIAPWPAASTAADLLARRGLVHKRRTRRAPIHPGVVPAITDAPNDLWTADFKGQLRTGNGAYCYPLTIRIDNGVPLLRRQFRDSRT